MNKALCFACELIRCQSMSPDDAHCQSLIANHLKALDFQIEFLPFGKVTNIWARRGNTAPVFCFAGHTDVVPPGELEKWQTPPFEPTIQGSYLYGRGAADMKSAIAAFLVATEAFVKKHPSFKGSIAFLLTSDEEGDAVDGTARVVETLLARNEMIDYCLIGEPTAQEYLGDTIKIGRRGSLTGYLTLEGKQGHVAYPHLTMNPIHALGKLLNSLTSTQWDEGSTHFEPTSFQASRLEANSGATNIVPNKCELVFNFRFSDKSTPESLQKKVQDLMNQANVTGKINWVLSSQPSLDKIGSLAKTLQIIAQSVTQKSCVMSTNGGASDGYFLQHIARELVEFGLSNKTIHQINECVAIEDIEKLTKIYLKLLESMLRA